MTALFDDELELHKRKCQRLYILDPSKFKCPSRRKFIQPGDVYCRETVDAVITQSEQVSIRRQWFTSFLR